MVDKITTIDGLAEMIQRTMASKEDLQRFATKEDLQRFATKEDLQRFATKEDLQRFATKEDVQKIRAEMATKADMEAGFFAVNRRIDLLHEDISDIPDIREAMKDYDNRLARVEQKVRLAT